MRSTLKSSLVWLLTCMRRERPERSAAARQQRVTRNEAVHVKPHEHQRRPERPRDQFLAHEAQNWLANIPRRVKPQTLAALHPRICNHFALIWIDPVLVEHYFSSLLIDNRGGRKGFEPDVTTELIRLHEYYTSTRGLPEKVKAWEERFLAVGDR